MRTMPSDWKALRLEEICAFHRGLIYKKTDEVEFSTNAVLRANNVSLESGELDLREIRYINDQIKIPAAKKVRKGSLLVCMASGSKKHLGKVALIDEDYGYAFGGFMGLLLPNAIVYPKYLYWLTQSKDYSDYIMGLSDGANINNLKFSQLGQYQVFLPPLPEQKRIVAILDEAFAGIATAVANTEKNLANARELFESYLNAVLSQQGEGWPQRTLVELCDIARGGSPRPIKAFLTNEPDGVNWIKISDATASSKFIYETKQKIRREGVRRSRMVHEGDLLLSNSMSFGRPYIMKTSGCIHDGWLVLSDKSGLYAQEYLYYFLGSSDAYRQFDSRASGSTVRNLNIDLVRTVRVPVPPLDKQHEIASNLEDLGAECNRLESLYHQKSDALAELKQSLLQKAFSGELTAVPQDEIETALA